MRNFKKQRVLKFVAVLAIFGLMELFVQMNEETEEQTTYSVTLENLAHGNGETDGEAESKCPSTETNCEMTQDCSGGMCSILNAKKRSFANGCIKCCNYTCTVQAFPG